MESIRIGNEISIQWTITHDGIPEPLEGRKLNLQLSCMYGKYDITDYTIVGYTIWFTFYGKEQKICGNYTLTLFENKGERGMMVVDACTWIIITQNTQTWCCISIIRDMIPPHIELETAFK